MQYYIILYTLLYKQHPSILGHELRSAHYSYFWLLILKDALDHLLNITDIQQTLIHTEHRIHHEHKHHYIKAIHNSPYSDNLTCYTTFQPLANTDLSLLKLMINTTLPTLSPNEVVKEVVKIGQKSQFKLDIMENFNNKNIIINARKIGYKDYKYMLYGNNISYPLSFHINIVRTGRIQICQPPG